MKQTLAPLLTFALTLIALFPAGQAEAQAEIGAVQTCLSNPYCTAGLVVIGGITYWSVTQNGQTTYHPYSGEGEPEHLEDPEGETEEWTDRVWANDEMSAANQCRAYGHRVGAVFVKVRPLRGRAYECTFRTYRS